MPYRPHNWFRPKEEFVGPNWTPEQVARFYRFWSRAYIWGHMIDKHKTVTLSDIFDLLGLDYYAGIPVTFNLTKNSPEMAYLSAGVTGGFIVARLSSRRRLRQEQELSAALAEALPDEPEES
jgi:hypothetical protein